MVDRLPQGVSFTILADSCHSGGLLQHAKEQIGHSCTKKAKYSEGSNSSRSHDTTAHQDYIDDDAKYQHIAHNWPGTVKNRALPLSTLLKILQQKNPEIQVGNIRNTLFELFGEEASIKVRKSIKKAYIIAGSASSARVNEQTMQQRQPEKAGILLSGCQSDEVSVDANPTGDPRKAFGAMSDAVVTVLSEHRKHGKQRRISNKELVRRARLVLEKGGYNQHPGLYCSDDQVSSPFL